MRAQIRFTTREDYTLIAERTERPQFSPWLAPVIRTLRATACLPAEVEWSPRWERHGHAIEALRVSVDLVSVQRQLGHEDLTTTAIYLRYAGIDENRYLKAFTADTGPATEKRDRPSCGFTWGVDTRTGAMDLGGRVGAGLLHRLITVSDGQGVLRIQGSGMAHERAIRR